MKAFALLTGFFVGFLDRYYLFSYLFLLICFDLNPAFGKPNEKKSFFQFPSGQFGK